MGESLPLHRHAFMYTTAYKTTRTNNKENLFLLLPLCLFQFIHVLFYLSIYLSPICSHLSSSLTLVCSRLPTYLPRLTSADLLTYLSRLTATHLRTEPNQLTYTYLVYSPLNQLNYSWFGLFYGNSTFFRIYKV